MVEYNARFGDPECQAVLSLLETDLLDMFLACRNGTLDHLNIRWKPGAACCLVLASGGYPGKGIWQGYPITRAGKRRGDRRGLPRRHQAGMRTVLSFTNRRPVLGVTATGPRSGRQAIQGTCPPPPSAAARPTVPDMHFRTAWSAAPWDCWPGGRRRVCAGRRRCSLRPADAVGWNRHSVWALP